MQPMNAIALFHCCHNNAFSINFFGLTIIKILGMFFSTFSVHLTDHSLAIFKSIHVYYYFHLLQTAGVNIPFSQTHLRYRCNHYPYWKSQLFHFESAKFKIKKKQFNSTLKSFCYNESSCATFWQSTHITQTFIVTSY